jgi:lysozyme
VRIPARLLVASAMVVASIAGFEGYSGVAYDDGVGVYTNGFGTTGGVHPGDKTDPVRAVQRLAKDADETARGIQKCIGDIPLYPYEFSAYVIFSYNVGVSAFCGSTLVKKLRAGDYAGACAELSRWTKAGGRELRGLVKRRTEERAMCEGK